MKVKKVNSNKTLRIVMAALMAAMACVATMVIKIPIPATGGHGALALEHVDGHLGLVVGCGRSKTS